MVHDSEMRLSLIGCNWDGEIKNKKRFFFQEYILHLPNPVYYLFNGPWLCNVPVLDRLRLSQWDQKQNMFLFQDHILQLRNPLNYVFNGPWLCTVPLLDRLWLSQWDQKQKTFLDSVLCLSSIGCDWVSEIKNKIRFFFRIIFCTF